MKKHGGRYPAAANGVSPSGFQDPAALTCQRNGHADSNGAAGKNARLRRSGRCVSPRYARGNRLRADDPPRDALRAAAGPIHPLPPRHAAALCARQPSPCGQSAPERPARGHRPDPSLAVSTRRHAMRARQPSPCGRSAPGCHVRSSRPDPSLAASARRRAMRAAAARFRLGTSVPAGATAPLPSSGAACAVPSGKTSIVPAPWC